MAKSLIGRSLRDFTMSHPSGAMLLLEAGRITGHETLQIIKATGQRRRLWISALPDPESSGLVVGTFLKEEATGAVHIPWTGRDASEPVIGIHRCPPDS